MERFERVGKMIYKLGHFVDIHNCGYPTESNPVNLRCESSDGLIFYIEQGLREKKMWSIDYTYDPNTKKRCEMTTIHGIKTQKAMLEAVKSIIEGYKQ